MSRVFVFFEGLTTQVTSNGSGFASEEQPTDTTKATSKERRRAAAARESKRWAQAPTMPVRAAFFELVSESREKGGLR